MANYYTDHPEIAFYFQHPLMRRIVELREKGFADKDLYPEAPVDYEDCIENYKRLLEITGDVAANTIASWRLSVTSPPTSSPRTPRAWTWKDRTSRTGG